MSSAPVQHGACRSGSGVFSSKICLWGPKFRVSSRRPVLQSRGLTPAADKVTHLQLLDLSDLSICTGFDAGSLTAIRYAPPKVWSSDCFRRNWEHRLEDLLAPKCILLCPASCNSAAVPVAIQRPASSIQLFVVLRAPAARGRNTMQKLNHNNRCSLTYDGRAVGKIS